MERKHSEVANPPESGGVALPTVSNWMRLLAQVCWHCPVCRRARRRQGGMAYALVRRVENRFCPFCRAYARVFGRGAHESPHSPPSGQIVMLRP